MVRYLLFATLFSLQVHASSPPGGIDHHIPGVVVRYEMELIIEVPRKEFEVSTPAGDGWLSRTQHFNWDPFRRTLNPIQKQLYLRSSYANITARLLQQPMLNDASGMHNITINVQVNGVALTTTAQQIISAAEAANGRTVAFELLPQAPETGYQPGHYVGVVAVVFEASI